MPAAGYSGFAMRPGGPCSAEAFSDPTGERSGRRERLCPVTAAGKQATGGLEQSAERMIRPAGWLNLILTRSRASI